MTGPRRSASRGTERLRDGAVRRARCGWSTDRDFCRLRVPGGWCSSARRTWSAFHARTPLRTRSTPPYRRGRGDGPRAPRREVECAGRRGGADRLRLHLRTERSPCRPDDLRHEACPTSSPPSASPTTTCCCCRATPTWRPSDIDTTTPADPRDRPAGRRWSAPRWTPSPSRGWRSRWPARAASACCTATCRSRTRPTRSTWSSGPRPGMISNPVTIGPDATLEELDRALRRSTASPASRSSTPTTGCSASSPTATCGSRRSPSGRPPRSTR